MHMNFGNVLVLIISIISAFLMTYGIYGKGAFATGGKIWGIEIEPTPAQKRFSKNCSTMKIIGIIGTISMMIPFFASFFKILFNAPILIILFFPLWVGACFAGALSAKKKGSSPELGEKGNNALVLGDLEFIKVAESHIPEAKCFFIDGEGIAFVNAHDYCFAVERYEDYRLGSLSDGKQVALVGSYFEQRYKGMFDIKSQFERIPPTPGKLVTFVGSRGISFGYVEGTKYQANFEGFLFTKKY